MSRMTTDDKAPEAQPSTVDARISQADEDGTFRITTTTQSLSSQQRKHRGLRTKTRGTRRAHKANRTHCGHHCQIEARTCAGVLEYLATGVPPSSIPSYDNAGGDEIEQVEEDVERAERLLTTALAILLDSTSPGPDPLALSALGWAYGMGGGGGMGDWGGCHYVPGEIGAELRELEDRVALKVRTEYSHETNYNVTRETSDESMKRVVPATRFCTVGALPPKKKPYAPGGALWQPPIAGICVPSSCTNKNLLMLFSNDTFRESLLLKAASITTSSDSSTSLDGNTTFTNYYMPPAASRRYKYVSSLSLSITMGLNFRMGIQCAGETGLQELDESFLGEPFHNTGYKCTIALILSLVVFVIIGTISSGWSSEVEVEMDEHRSSKCNHTSTITARNGVEEPRAQSPGFGKQESFDLINYGSTIDERRVNGEDGIVAPSDICRETGDKTAGSCGHGRKLRHAMKEKLSMWTERSMASIKHIFSPFNATQNFYEITRMSRDNPFEDRAQQEMMKTEGESTLDRAYSSTGLFPTYGADDEGNRDNLATSESASSSHCLNGMRSISMFWIILGHTIVVQSSVGYQNPSAVLPPTGMISSTPAMFFFSARYAVDTFFFIAGYLVMSGLLKKLDPAVVWETTESKTSKKMTEVEQWLHEKKITNPSHAVIGKYAHRLRSVKKSKDAPPAVFKWMIPLLMHRVLRILPTYSFVLLLWWKVAVTLGNGPFWPRWATFVAQCDKYAWTNMLFINNLVPWRQKLGETSECMYHAWYLGVDMQLCAVLTPLFVSFYLRRGCRKVVMILELAFIALIVCASFINTFRRDWSGHLMDGLETMNFDRDFYINPFYRATPYLVGFITAQVWHEKSRLCPNLGLRKSVSTILSIFSASLLIFLTFVGSSAYNDIPCMVWQSMHTNECGSGWKMYYLAIYNSFVRPAWSLGLAIMSLLGFNGQLHVLGGSRVLNWAGWDPVSKLSFGMYLLHPLVINVWFLSRTSKFSYSHVDFIFLCAAVITVTFLGALAVGLLVEWPMSKITKHFETWLMKGKMSSADARCEKGNPDAGLSLHNLQHARLSSEERALLSSKAG